MKAYHLNRLSEDEALLIELYRNTLPDSQAAVLVFALAAREHHVGQLPTNVFQFHRRK